MAPDASGSDPEPPRNNGLHAPSYVPLIDVEVAVGPPLLTALARARIAAYLSPAPAPAPDSLRSRLFVAADERVDARTIASAVLRAVGELTDAADLVESEPHPDPLAGVDTDAAFADIIADWHVDTVQAIRDAKRALSRDDEQWQARLQTPPAEPVWLDEDHYIPPAPPPMPRFAAPTIVAMSVLVLAILVLGFGGEFGLASQLSLLLGVSCLILGAMILIMRLRERHDDDDDGAIL